MGRLRTYKTYKVSIILCFFSFFVSGQDISVSLDAIPRETVYLSSNSNLFVVGETLYYNFFSLFNQNKPSSISKVGYVELIGEDGTGLFKHKLKLDNGLSFGDYFIPSHIKTGHYKLVAYTKWMEDMESVFLNDVYIINPFLEHSSSLNTEGVTIQSNVVEIDVDTPEELTGIKIETNSEVLKPKDELSVHLINDIGDLYYGNYALSVRKVAPVKIQHHTVTKDDNEIKKISHYNSLPELRGEIISGVVKLKSNDSLVPNVKVSLSIPGKHFILKTAQANQAGRFYFSLYENYTSTDALIQVLDEKRQNDYKIVLDHGNRYDFSNVSFDGVQLDRNLKDWLIENSTYNQIENAYFNSKKDSVISRVPSKLFYTKPDVEYVLDDYKRFPTLKETFIEVIQSGAIRNHNGKLKFKVDNFVEDRINYYSDYNPLVLFDGILIQNNEDIMDYDAGSIERINIVRGTYFYGPEVYYGIVDIQTKKGDFVLPKSATDPFYFHLEAPLKSKHYYNPNYKFEADALNRIPDYRNQLFWQPNIRMDSNFKSIKFYTSEVTGVFEIVLEGFTFGGKHIVLKKRVEVKN